MYSCIILKKNSTEVHNKHYLYEKQNDSVPYAIHRNLANN